MKAGFALLSLLSALSQSALSQSADWTEVIWREPQVRYLLADMTLNGGQTGLYRKYAAEERDPDSREAIRLWDAGARVVNTNDFERRWLTNKFGKDGRVLRIVHRGTEDTITGEEVILTRDLTLDRGIVRITLAELSLGRKTAYDQALRDVPEIAEAMRRWEAGDRLVNQHLFALIGPPDTPRLAFRGTDADVKDPFHFRFLSDLPHPETNVRYFMADIALGGSIEFYRAAAERHHEMGCLEAVRRTEEGYRITNLDQFERKRVNGKTVITRKGSDVRISGLLVKLSSDSQP